jgi:hypothetical protein
LINLIVDSAIEIELRDSSSDRYRDSLFSTPAPHASDWSVRKNSPATTAWLARTSLPLDRKILRIENPQDDFEKSLSPRCAMRVQPQRQWPFVSDEWAYPLLLRDGVSRWNKTTAVSGNS